LALVVVPWLCGCYGLEAGSNYPDYDFDVDDQLLTPENDESPSISLGEFVIRDEICAGLNTRVEIRELSQDDLSRHLDKINSPPAQVKARGNLYWFDFVGDEYDEGASVRLRLAVLGDAKEAADELHKSILEHGPGWWGFRRSNLSVLAPKASINEAITFALRYKLPCWGMMEMANLDDVVVVPGPYMEF
jgi:hypothetical protein